MANVLNRNNLSDYRVSVNTPDYDPSDWLINPSLGAVAGLDPIYWKLNGDFVVPMTNDERNAVDLARLPALIASAQDQLDADANEFINERYPAHRQRTLTMLLSEARDAGLTNRANYVLQAVGWLDTVFAYFYSIWNAIENVTSAGELAAITGTWDFTPFADSDPLVTIYQTRLITD